MLPICLAAQSFINHGPQIFESHLEGSQFVKDENGNDWLYTVLRGSPGRLLGYDLSDNSLQVNLPLIQMEGSWDIVQSSDGWLYIAGPSGGRFARHKPGTQLIQDLGKPISTENYLFALAAGINGEIFGASYPGCRVFRYHPDDGFSDVGNGPIKTGESYARSLVYHHGSDKLFVGIGAHSYLVELDPRTGSKQEILPPAYQGVNGFVYDLKIISDLNGGDRLLGVLNELGKTFVYNLDTKVFENEISRSVTVKSAIKSLSDQKIYFNIGDQDFYHYSITKTCPRQTKIGETGRVLALKWLNQNELLSFNVSGELKKINVNTQAVTTYTLSVPQTPIRLQVVKSGPDGRIWTGGYLAGNNAAYDPSLNVTTPYKGLGQSEGIFNQGNKLYFGIYTRARFYEYDTTEPWSLTAQNPKFIGQATNQDRPFAGINIDSLNRMYFGTVPNYGVLGGTLVEYDAVNGTMNQYPQVITNHSIVTLEYKSGFVYGGTSVWGGLGISPVDNSAKLFVWDISSNTKTFEFVPVIDAKAITSLMVGNDGNIWGMADGTLFIFNPVTKQIVSVHELFQVSQTIKENHVWKNSALIWHPNGKIYGVAYGELFELNPLTKVKTQIKTGVSFSLTLANNGDLYFMSMADLWQYTP